MNAPSEQYLSGVPRAEPDPCRQLLSTVELVKLTEQPHLQHELAHDILYSAGYRAYKQNKT
jgi:hypothetical protein